jgi:hypothetical protein
MRETAIKHGGASGAVQLPCPGGLKPQEHISTRPETLLETANYLKIP